MQDVDRNKIRIAVKLHSPIEIVSYVLPREKEMYIQEVLSEFLNECHQEHLTEGLKFCITELLVNAKKANVPVITCMGTGNKLDPTLFQVADIYQTKVCPLAKVMRKELKVRSVKKLKVVYSKEEALSPTGWEEEAKMLGKRQIPGSVSFVPGTAGLILAGEVIKDLASQ